MEIRLTRAQVRDRLRARLGLPPSSPLASPMAMTRDQAVVALRERLRLPAVFTDVVGGEIDEVRARLRVSAPPAAQLIGGAIADAAAAVRALVGLPAVMPVGFTAGTEVAEVRRRLAIPDAALTAMTDAQRITEVRKRLWVTKSTPAIGGAGSATRATLRAQLHVRLADLGSGSTLADDEANEALVAANRWTREQVWWNAAAIDLSADGSAPDVDAEACVLYAVALVAETWGDEKKSTSHRQRAQERIQALITERDDAIGAALLEAAADPDADEEYRIQIALARAALSLGRAAAAQAADQAAMLRLRRLRAGNSVASWLRQAAGMPFADADRELQVLDACRMGALSLVDEASSAVFAKDYAARLVLAEIVVGAGLNEAIAAASVLPWYDADCRVLHAAGAVMNRIGRPGGDELIARAKARAVAFQVTDQGVISAWIRQASSHPDADADGEAGVLGAAWQGAAAMGDLATAKAFELQYRERLRVLRQARPDYLAGLIQAANRQLAIAHPYTSTGSADGSLASGSASVIDGEACVLLASAAHRREAGDLPGSAAYQEQAATRLTSLRANDERMLNALLDQASAQAFERFHWVQTTDETTIAVAAGTGRVGFPSPVQQPEQVLDVAWRAIDATGDDYRPVPRAAFPASFAVPPGDNPSDYQKPDPCWCQVRSTIELWPVPNRAGTLRLTYRVDPVYATDADVLPVDAELIVLLATWHYELERERPRQASAALARADERAANLARGQSNIANFQVGGSAYSRHVRR